MNKKARRYKARHSRDPLLPLLPMRSSLKIHQSETPLIEACYRTFSIEKARASPRGTFGVSRALPKKGKIRVIIMKIDIKSSKPDIRQFKAPCPIGAGYRHAPQQGTTLSLHQAVIKPDTGTPMTDNQAKPDHSSGSTKNERSARL